ncbi:unnamed protein product [Haemonchus placei]|uniref:Uncharacterized protein n=1 Tax=Haemonchus placei TaxID=6290 RepID=A0A3P7T3U8_HAEPC|nr:unnamed protein product [Haemonchus placei]
MLNNTPIKNIRTNVKYLSDSIEIGKHRFNNIVVDTVVVVEHRRKRSWHMA